jgi:probable F420-dependent oxidoreductase
MPYHPFGNILESMTTLSYLAAHTTTIGLGTGILVLPQRDPVLVAKQAATVDHLSNGRFTLATAVGYIEAEYKYLRADFAQRGRLADEYIAAIRALLETADARFHGEHINFDNVWFDPRPAKPIPLVVGGNSAAAITRAATLGDGWYGWRRRPDQVSEALGRLAEHKVGDSFEVALRVEARVGGAIPGIEPARSLQGDREAVAAQIARYDAAGVDRLVIDLATTDLSDYLNQIHTLAALHDPSPSPHRQQTPTAPDTQG